MNWKEGGSGNVRERFGDEVGGIFEKFWDDGLGRFSEPTDDLSFGDGSAGASARRILDGCSCFECNMASATRTVDFDWPGTAELTQIPSCGGCEPVVRARVWKDLSNAGKQAIFNSMSTNGKGRF